MKLAICGDSWFTVDKNFPGRSFGEIVCERNSWQLFNYALTGCSNFGICLQIDKALEHDPDFVIVGITTPDRIEIPIFNQKSMAPWRKIREFFTWDTWFSSAPSAYRRHKGLDNIYYEQGHIGNIPWLKNDPTVYTGSLNNFIWMENFRKLTQEQRDALKSYMLNLYDHEVKREIDVRMLNDAVQRLERKKIPYLLCIESLDSDRSLFPSIPSEKIMTLDQFQFGALPRSGKASFHYSDQQNAGEMFADYIKIRIDNQLGVSQ
jgi:hypothetical protein